jgi:membrane protease YdiL (CAAX protease family)
VSDRVVPEPSAERAAPPLNVLVLPCLVGFVAWELARVGLAWLPAAWASTPLLWSVVRALLLLAPAVFVTRRRLGERIVSGFWLGAPERVGLLRSLLIGAGYLVLVNGLDVALGNPFTMPAIAPATLALTLFDAGVEEALFRGFFLSHVLRGRRVARAQLIAASLYLLPHVRKLLDFWSMGLRFELPLMALGIFVLGLVLGATARPVRSIWIATLVHGVNNLFASS